HTFARGVSRRRGPAPLADSIQVTRDPGATVDSVSVVSDVNAPSGSITYPNATLASHSVPVSASATAGESGLAGISYERASATLVGSTCGPFGGFTPITLT